MFSRFGTLGCAILAAALVATFGASAAAAADSTPPLGSHDGTTDTIAAHDHCYANGWALDPDDLSQHINVRILADGAVVATEVADDFRQDLLDAGIGDGRYAFWVDLRGLVASDVAHEIRIQAQDLQTSTWSDLDFTPRQVTCTQLYGSHDIMSGVVGRADCVAAGWAFDADTDAAPRVRVRIVVDGRVVADTTADEFREDVRDAGFGDGYSGFTVDLWGRLTPNRAHTVRVEMRDTTAKRIWVPLADTDKALTCVPNL